MRWWVIALLVAGTCLVLIGGNTFVRLTGHFLPRDSPEARAALLAPDFDLRLPDGPGPFPALALFSGCDGVRDNMGLWADAAVAQGWAALIVDSHTPRGLDDYEVWRVICAGQLLTGAERAGDVGVALDALRSDPRIDSDRLLLVGASHGGWAVLDFLAFLQTGRRPDGLTAWPGGSASAAGAGVVGAFVLYPYCGPGSRAARAGWPDGILVTMILVEDDRITGEEPCEDLAQRMRDTGRTVDLSIARGVTHGFDQKERSALSALEFDEAATAVAMARFLALLDGIEAP